MHFGNYILTILFKNAKLNIKKQKNKTKQKKNATQVFQNFGSVGKGQTNIFFFFFKIKKFFFRPDLKHLFWAYMINTAYMKVKSFGYKGLGS